jgi:phosphatidylinositol glycan class A protein
MVSDFFYPRLGGVEMHIWSLSHQLLALGHKVIVITHAYNCPNGSKRTGVRYLPGGLKVYHIPFLPMVDEDCLPTFTVSLPLMRWIFIREGIEIVHAHQATSTLANEAVVYAAELGLASVYTDHSLFGFDDVASIILNQVSLRYCCVIL